jgi:cytochrome c oxidase assembly protein subunit 11
MTTRPDPSRPDHKRNRLLLAVLLGFTGGMIGLTFASAPLYRIFCQATGFGGTTQTAKSAPGATGTRVIEILFNADVAPGLPWAFEPEQRQMTVRPGEPSLALFRATNRSSREITGSATYNVTPDAAGLYFDKIQCFCFSEQRLGPGETAELPVTFFVDPAIAADPNARDIPAITLSYTFFLAKPRAPTAQIGLLPPSGTPSEKEAVR